MRPFEMDADEAEVFDKVYLFMLENQYVTCHPDMPPMDAEHWQTICFNAAVLAAGCMGGGNLTIHDDDDRVLATTELATGMH